MENTNNIVTPETLIQNPIRPEPVKPNIFKYLFIISLIILLIIIISFYFILNNKISKITQIQPTPTTIPIEVINEITPINTSYKATSIQDDKNSVSKLVLIDENQKEITISEEKYLTMPVGVSKPEFRDIIFSPDYNFLSYMLVGYEGGDSRLYDIKNKKEMSLNFPAKTLGFTPDSKYFYACAPTGMLGGGAVVKKLPELSDIFSRVGAEDSFNCEYNQNNGEITFYGLDWRDNKGIISEYKFSEKSGSILKTK